MDSSTGGSTPPDRSRWRFDPNTGQPVGDTTPQPTPPSSHDAPTQYAPPQYPPSYQQQPTMPMPQPAQPVAVKPRSRAPIIIGVGLVVLLAVLTGGGYFLYQNVFNRPAVSVERLLPTNTLGYFSFDPVLEGSQKAAMDKIGAAFEAQPGFKEAWSKMVGSATEMVEGPGSSDSTATPGTADLDILSTYLGNSVTIAILPPSTDDLEKLKSASQDGTMSDVMGDMAGRNVVGIVDLDFNPLNKKGPITDLKQNAISGGKAELVEKYRDIEIRKYVTNTTEIYFALLDGSSTAVVGMKADPLHVVIDGFKDNKSLKDDATFKALSGQVPGERIAALYLNLTEIYKQANLVAPEMLQSGSLQNASGAMLLTLSAADDGMQLDIASEADLNVMNSGVQVNADAKPDGASLNDIPADSLGFLAGTDLATPIKSVLESLRKDKNTGANVDQTITDFEKQFGISLENDVLPLLGGDYSLSVSTASQSLNNPAFSFVFQMKLKDSAKALSLLDKVASSDAAKGATQKLSIADGTFYTSSDGREGTLIGVTHDRLVVVADTTALDAARARLESTVKNLGKGLGTTDQWNAAKAHLPRDSNNIIFFDLKTVRTLAENSMDEYSKPDYEQSIAPFVRPFKFLLLGSATQAAKNGTLSRNLTRIFIGISK